MGHLVPQSVNMWMGCAPEGTRGNAAAAVVAWQYSSCQSVRPMVQLRSLEVQQLPGCTASGAAM
jgi:hypothetical protein